MTILKEECVKTRSTIVNKPLEGSAKIYDQGEGITQSSISVKGDFGSATCNVFGEDCAGLAQIGTSQSAYAGTPYTISIIRCIG